MEIIAKTLLTNKTERDRHVKWAGVCLEPQETRIVEGFYPGSCKTPSDVKDMNADVDGGIIGVVLITNLPTAKPEEAKREVGKKPPTKLKGTEPVKLDGEDTREAMSEVGKQVDERVFQRGSIDDAAPKETMLKQPSGDEAPEALRPQETVFFGGDDPRGTVPGTEDDPLQNLGEIPAPEVTRGAAKMIEEAGLTDKQMALLTENGSAKRVTLPMVKKFLKQEGVDNGEDGVLVGPDGEDTGPDPDSFD